MKGFDFCIFHISTPPLTIPLALTSSLSLSVSIFFRSTFDFNCFSELLFDYINNFTFFLNHSQLLPFSVTYHLLRVRSCSGRNMNQAKMVRMVNGSNGCSFKLVINNPKLLQLEKKSSYSSCGPSKFQCKQTII